MGNCCSQDFWGNFPYASKDLRFVVDHILPEDVRKSLTASPDDFRLRYENCNINMEFRKLVITHCLKKMNHNLIKIIMDYMGEPRKENDYWIEYGDKIHEKIPYSIYGTRYLKIIDERDEVNYREFVWYQKHRGEDSVIPPTHIGLINSDSWNHMTNVPKDGYRFHHQQNGFTIYPIQFLR